ncbi:MAG TPA: hypothetical protein VFQ61_32645 [Polyangiaceae bacterium]|nr:hypothetical protein [Polyangiaceae bacterium]
MERLAMSVLVRGLLGVGTTGVAIHCAACSNREDATAADRSSGGETQTQGGSTGTLIPLPTGGGTVKTQNQHLVVTPESEVATVKIGESPSPISLTATLDGVPVNAMWSVDYGNIGVVRPRAGSRVTFTPSGTTAGSVQITASTSSASGMAKLSVRLVGAQNGANIHVAGEAAQIAGSLGDLTLGGGIGGVGGEGLGPAVTDGDVAALANPQGDGAREQLSLLYPYDRTVWPRGMLAPLLMWKWSVGDADAIRIDLSTVSGNFSWSGTFGRPAILESLAPTGTGSSTESSGRFIRHPIPQDIWEIATNSATSSDPLQLELSVARDGKAYGPVRRIWPVAPGRLTGTVYYGSYATALVENSGQQRRKGGGAYGSGVLAIRSGETRPRLIAGQPSTDDKGCRGCHMVAANGSRLIAQTTRQYYGGTATYDLLRGNQETQLGVEWDKVFAWAALSPDGTLAFTSQLRFGVAEVGPPPPASRLYAFPPEPGALPIPVEGLSSDVQVGTPAFSPDGKRLAFYLMGGMAGAISGTGNELVAGDFDRSAMAFSNARLLASTADPERAGFPSFLPTGDALLFHHQLRPLASVPLLPTGGVEQEARLDWSDLDTGTSAPLHTLNGARPDGSSYLPTSDLHPDDTLLNFQPNVNPVSTGGYFWVVFTSRRLYGNLAESHPWYSDPGRYDLTDYSDIPLKKLWVAAIDMGSYVNGQFVPGNAPGSDPSHPAFYLPAQELMAGNSRGYWVLDPCKNNGAACESGDQCCEGYCRPSGDGGTLVCAGAPPTSQCAQVQEACEKSADCCDAANVCVNRFCAFVSPEPPR